MLQEEKFIGLTESLSGFAKEKHNHNLQKSQSLESSFLHSCEILTSLYKAEQKRLKEKYIEPFTQKYYFLEQKSILQVIKKTHWETFHSLLLKYLWENPKLLYPFIEKVPNIENKELILELIRRGNYAIKEEHSIRNKKSGKAERFIDLLITDTNKKWLIVIENKIYSDVSKNKNGKGTQLDSYYHYIENNKIFQTFENKIYILLSYSDNTKYSNAKWIYVDYYKVFSSMLENSDTNNAILIDYLKTLYQLLFNNKEINSDISLYAIRKFYIEVQSKIK